MLGLKITCNVSFQTAENQSPKHFSSCLMLVILYHLKSYCNILLPYLTTFTVHSSLEMPITTFPALRNPKVPSVFKGQTQYFLYTEFNIIFAKVPNIFSVDILSHNCSMRNIKIVSLNSVLLQWLCSMV